MLRSALQKQHGAIIDDLKIRVFRTKADLPDWNAEIVGGERVVEDESRTLLKETVSSCSGNLDWPTERQRHGGAPHTSPHATEWNMEASARSPPSPAKRSPPRAQRTNIRNPGWSPTTVMCPLQGEVSSNRNTLPGGSRLVSPSVVVMEKTPCRTMPN